VTVLLDTGILYAYYDADDRWHGPAVRLMSAEAGRLVVPSPILPEADYLLGHRLGRQARAALYRGIVEDRFFVVDLSAAGYRRVRDLDERYADLGLGFVDSAVIAIAEELRIPRVATTDRRHFPAVEATIGLELVPDPP